MREILFRGKRKVNEEWVYGFPFVSRKGEYKIKWYDPHYGSAKTSEVYPETIGQFIGLTDKNGKKIFEGDVVDVEGVAYRCRWDDGNFEFGLVNEIESFGIVYATHSIEVIGNIYDNPELLEV